MKLLRIWRNIISIQYYWKWRLYEMTKQLPWSTLCFLLLSFSFTSAVAAPLDAKMPSNSDSSTHPHLDLLSERFAHFKA
jgi:hypothetical protein